MTLEDVILRVTKQTGEPHEFDKMVWVGDNYSIWNLVSDLKQIIKEQEEELNYNSKWANYEGMDI